MLADARRFLVLLAICLAGCGSSSSPERTARRSVEEALTQEQALATFDATWQSIADSHFDRDFNGVDWEAVRVEFRPRAEAASNREELREVLSAMLARLGQSHFEVMPSASTDATSEEDTAGDVGLDVHVIDGEVVVTAVREGGPAQQAQVATGWRLVRLDKLALDPLVPEVVAPEVVRGGSGLDENFAVWFALHQALAGPVGSQVSLAFETGGGDTVEKTLAREARPGTPIRFANLPPFYADLTWRAIDRGPHRVGYIRFNIWMLPVARPFDVAVDSLRGASGIVVDLRGNVGGVGELVRGLAGHFLTEPASLGSFRTRDLELEYTARPKRVDTAGQRVTPYQGPLAILVDEATASSSEIFAAGLQAVGRGRVFGCRSAGAVLPAQTTILPNGDTLLHATADFVTPTGQRLEGEGVLPDEEIHPTRDDYLEGVDPVLEAALEWIQKKEEEDS